MKQLNDHIREKLCEAIAALLDDGTIEARVSHANQYLIMLNLYELEIPNEMLNEFNDIIDNITNDLAEDKKLKLSTNKLTPKQEREMVERLLSMYIRINGGNLIY